MDRAMHCILGLESDDPKKKKTTLLAAARIILGSNDTTSQLLLLTLGPTATISGVILSAGLKGEASWIIRINYCCWHD